jgi:hypothetical protein
LGQFQGPMGALILDRRRSKFRRVEEKLKSGASFKFIIPRAVIERYVREGVPNADEYEASISPTWRSSLKERKARIENLISFLKGYNNYELVLSDQDFFEVWWGVYDQDCVVIQHIFSYVGQPVDYLTFVVKGEKAPQVIADRVALYQHIWTDLTKGGENKQEIIDYLSGLLNQIRE